MREIDDAVRQDQFSDFAKTYGKPLLAILVAGLVGFGGYLFWQTQSEKSLEERSEKLVAALDQAQAGNFDSAETAAAALVEEGDGGAAISAQMLRASVAMDQGKPQEAAELFASVAANEDAPEVLRNIAMIRAMTANFDDRDPQEVVDAMLPLAVPGEPFFGSAGELVAMAYLEQDKTDEAGAMFGEIARSDDVPETLRARSRQMAGLLGVDAIEDVEELLEEQSVDAAGDAQLVSP